MLMPVACHSIAGFHTLDRGMALQTLAGAFEQQAKHSCSCSQKYVTASVPSLAGWGPSLLCPAAPAYLIYDQL